MTLIKIPIPKTSCEIEVVIAVDVTGPNELEDENDESALKLERMVGKYVAKMFTSIGVQSMEMMQD